jgi:hypothetical protein
MPIAHECDQPSLRVAVVRDLGGETAARFNARWQPRAYAVDERGELVYVQPAETRDGRTPEEVLRLWEPPRLAAREGVP